MSAAKFRFGRALYVGFVVWCVAACLLCGWLAIHDATASRAVNGGSLGATSSSAGTIDLTEPPFLGAAGGWTFRAYRAAGGMTGCTSIKVGTAVFTSITSSDDQHCQGTAAANPSITGGLSGSSGPLTVTVTTPTGPLVSSASVYSHAEYLSEHNPKVGAYHTSTGVLTDAGHIYRVRDLTGRGNDYTRLDAGSLEPAQTAAWNGTPYPSITCATSDLEMQIDGGIDSGSFAVLSVVQNHTTTGVVPSTVFAGSAGAVFTYNDFHNLELSDGVFAATGAQTDTAPHVLGLSIGLDAGGGNALNRLYLDNAIAEGPTRTYAINSGRANHLCSLPGSYYGGATVYATADVQTQIVYDTTASPVPQADIENDARILAEFANITFPTYPMASIDAGQPLCNSGLCNVVFDDEMNNPAPPDGGTGVDYSKWVVEESLTFSTLVENLPIWPMCGTPANVVEDGGVVKLSVTSHVRPPGGCPTSWDASAVGFPLDAGTIYDVAELAMRPDFGGVSPPATIEIRAQMGVTTPGVGSVLWALGTACTGANKSVFSQSNFGQIGLTPCFWSNPPEGEFDFNENEGVVGLSSMDMWTNNGLHPSGTWTESTDPSSTFYVYTFQFTSTGFDMYTGLEPGGADKVFHVHSDANVNSIYYPISILLSMWAETNQPGNNTDAASLPRWMLVDYVRVFKPLE